MQRPFFYFAKLNRWDTFSIAGYILLTAGLGYYFSITTDDAVRRVILYVYAFWTQLMLFAFNYKSLRNLAVYLTWIAFGGVHLYGYFLFRENPMLQSPDSPAATGLRNTILLLLLFQLLRYVSIRAQGQELICPSLKNRVDLFDRRTPTFTDYILMAVYIGALFALYAFD